MANVERYWTDGPLAREAAAVVRDLLDDPWRAARDQFAAGLQIRRPSMRGSLRYLALLLRRAGSEIPAMSSVLTFVGSVLLILGLLSAFLQIVQQMTKSIAAIIAGCLCLVAALAGERGGLVPFLPPWLRHVLLRTTPFDLLLKNSDVVSAVRRWSRIFLLLGSAESPEADVQMIVKGLDPKFLDVVFRKSVIRVLPVGVQWLLTPEDNMAAADLARSACSGEEPVTPAWIRNQLRRKRQQAKQRRASSEPPLAPVLRSLLQTGSAEAAFNSALRRTVREGLQVATTGFGVASMMWAAAAVFFRTPMSHDIMAWALRQVLPRGVSPEASAGRHAAQAATCISLLGAGGSLVAALFITRCWLPTTTCLPPTRGEVRAVLPCAPAWATQTSGGSEASSSARRRAHAFPPAESGLGITVSTAPTSAEVPSRTSEPETEVSPETSETEETQRRRERFPSVDSMDSMDPPVAPFRSASLLPDTTGLVPATAGTNNTT